ncbi:sialidase family protein [Streptomyces sp. Q6]|uniref:Sialidase family protein n=1 Tax=Streptomyces citrinus TaxID=3118173 RepID=A0ACD5A9P3_9ACTN
MGSRSVTAEHRATPETSVPFRAGEEGYASFRSPAVVRAPGSTFFAFREGRRGSREDHQDIAVVVRRSTDGAVGLLHETGDFSPYETITFRRIPVAAPTGPYARVPYA